MDVLHEKLNSETLLDEIKRRKGAKDIVDVEEAREKVVIFTIAGRRYAFFGVNVKEILPAMEISWVPSLPEYLPGLINVRGDIESVADIRLFLGEKPADPSKSLILLVVCGDFRSGILVDGIDDVVDVPTSAIEPPLATLLDLGKLSSRISV